MHNSSRHTPAEDLDAAVRAEALRVADAARHGQVVLYPTDTVWGLGCDACNPAAVERVYALKQRPDSKALITLVDSVDMLLRYVPDVPEVALQLIEAAVDPLTIVYDSAIGVAPCLVADDGSIGIRVVNDPFCRSVIRALRRPLVSTSANLSGDPTPHCFNEISPAIVNGADCVALHRRDEPSSPAKPSSVIKLSASGEIKILRP